MIIYIYVMYARKGDLREFYLNITYECNSNCIFCAAEHEITGQCGHMEFGEIKKAS